LLTLFQITKLGLMTGVDHVLTKQVSIWFGKVSCK